MSIKAAGRSVPVVWSPSDLSGPDSDGHLGRETAIRAIVHHRVVGTLESMTNTTFKPSDSPLLLPGERRVSSHFGIGFWGDQLRIVQYVALENTAYCNGQSAADIDALRSSRPWSVYTAVRSAFGRHVSANEFTVSIEHEDNASTGKYIVREEIKQASIELDRLMLSGNGAAIRAAGIRCSDGAAAQLGKIVPSRSTLVDHNVAAPVSKPYCWRPYGSDQGFPQARYIADLSAADPATPDPVPQEEIMRSFGVYEERFIVGVKTGAWLFHSSDLKPDPDNVQVSPGRDLVYVGTLSTEVRIVAYEGTIPDANGSSRAMFVRTEDLDLTTLRKAPLPTEDCSQEVAAERARWTAWVNARPQ